MWTMSTRKDENGVHVFIGQIKIASIVWNGVELREYGRVRLVWEDPDRYQIEHFPGVSEALKKVHALLNAPIEA